MTVRADSENDGPDSVPLTSILFGATLLALSLNRGRSVGRWVWFPVHL